MGMGDFVTWDWSAPNQELLDVPHQNVMVYPTTAAEEPLWLSVASAIPYF
jgi:hypothetical protein